MRKILFALIMCLLLIFTGIIITNGLEIGNINVWGVKEIISQNDEVDRKNADLSALVSTTYPDSIKKLDSTAKAMQKSKTEYENKVVLFNDSSYYLQTEEYEIEFLWTKIGNYAKDNDVEIKIEVTNSQLKGRYDLNFTVTGKYSDVTQFIYDIENDSKLGFKIENFNMVSSQDGVQGKFSCKEIKIDIKEKEIQNNQNENKTTDKNKQEEDKDDMTNTVNTNSTTNTTTNTSTENSASTTDILDEVKY